VNHRKSTRYFKGADAHRRLNRREYRTAIARCGNVPFGTPYWTNEQKRTKAFWQVAHPLPPARFQEMSDGSLTMARLPWLRREPNWEIPVGAGPLGGPRLSDRTVVAVAPGLQAEWRQLRNLSR